jgi:hypothetical protein
MSTAPIGMLILLKNKKVSQNRSCQLSYLLLPATVRLPRLDNSLNHSIMLRFVSREVAIIPANFQKPGQCEQW